MSQAKIKAPPKPHVTFANINPGLVTCELFGSFVHLLSLDMQKTHHIDAFICKKSGGLLSIYRNGVVAEFLDECTSEWLWMVDSDIILETDTLNLLMRAAALHPEAQIVTGWYVLPMGEEDGNKPSTYEWRENNFEFVPLPDKISYIDSTGLGCVMVHRDLLVCMYEKYGLPSPWFTLLERPATPELPARVFGEDHSFFLRTLQDFDQRPLLVPEAMVGHVKSAILTKEHLT